MPASQKCFIAAVLISCLTGCTSDDPGIPTADNGTPPPAVEINLSIGADEYLDNRFFRLDLPAEEMGGRQPGEKILLSSLKIFKLMEPDRLEPNDVANIAAYIDTAGCKNWSLNDFFNPGELGARWQQVTDFTPLIDREGHLENIDLRSSQADDEILAVAYSVVDAQGNLIAKVGDDPGLAPPEQQLPGQGDTLFYRMKLLKAPSNRNHRHLFNYVRRNIYSLGQQQIDYESLDLQIEDLSGGDDPELAAENLPWIRLFGLDQMLGTGRAGHDGLIDKQDPLLLDLGRGLLKFPADNPYPFAAEPDLYLRYVQPDEFVWAGSYLANNLTPEIYDFQTPPYEYATYRKFKITGSFLDYDVAGGLLDNVPLTRTEWTWASAPLLPVAYGSAKTFDPSDRVEIIRWFLPRERVLRRYLDPDLSGAQGEETQPTLDLYLRTEDDAWTQENWGGIMMSTGPHGADLTGYQYLEFWVNDGHPEKHERSGIIHIDYGYINEDGFWPRGDNGLEVGTHQREDADLDGVWVQDEDIGLDGDEYGPQRYDASYEVDGDTPYPFINGTARNNREDDEDLDGNTRLDLANGYFSHHIGLEHFDSVVDVVYDYDDVQELVNTGIAWRLYRVDLRSAATVSESRQPDLANITHLRIWFEEYGVQYSSSVHLQFSGLRFLR